MARVWCLLCFGCLAACGQTIPDGTCLTDFDCQVDQLCGSQGMCLLCLNCQRGRLGTCTVPAFPIAREPDAVRIEASGLDERLVYRYDCASGESEFSYLRRAGQACFDPQPSAFDGCGLLGS